MYIGRFLFEIDTDHTLVFSTHSILSIGPTFDVNVEADAVLDLAVDLQVGLVYNISNAQLVFPSTGSAQSRGEFNIGDTRE